VPQGGVLDPVKFLAYVKDIWKNIDWGIRLFADDCIIYRKITSKNNISMLQKELDTLGEWVVANGMKINTGKSKAVRFTRARVKNPLGYSLGEQNILEANNCKCLGIILPRDLNWVDQVNYTAQRAWKALQFVMYVLKKGNRNTKSLAYTPLVVLFLNMGLHARIHAEKDR
jgi:hypothetical protein